MLLHADQAHHGTEGDNRTAVLPDHLIAYQGGHVKGCRGVDTDAFVHLLLILKPADTAVPLGKNAAAVDEYVYASGFLYDGIHQIADAVDVTLLEGDSFYLYALFAFQLFDEFLCGFDGVAGQIDICAGVCQSQRRALTVHGAAAGDQGRLSF